MAMDAPQGPELIVDNSPLVHVASQDVMFPGSYCYDASGEGTIFLWMLAPRTTPAKLDKAAQWWDNPSTWRAAIQRPSGGSRRTALARARERVVRDGAKLHDPV